MDMLAGLRASFSGLEAQRIRMNVIAANLANVNATRTPEGGPYKPRAVVFAAVPPPSPFAALLQDQLQAGVSQVAVVDIVKDAQRVRLEYDPGHPDANAEGYVAYPDINILQEMVDLLTATRSYEANVTAINAAKDMTLRALQIGRV